MLLLITWAHATLHSICTEQLTGHTEPWEWLQRDYYTSEVLNSWPCEMLIKICFPLMKERQIYALFLFPCMQFFCSLIRTYNVNHQALWFSHKTKKGILVVTNFYNSSTQYIQSYDNIQYLAAAGVSGTVISLWPIPTRQTFPPGQVALSAVDMVLLKPAQSKLTSTLVPIALCICTTSSATSCKIVKLKNRSCVLKQQPLELEAIRRKER